MTQARLFCTGILIMSLLCLLSACGSPETLVVDAPEYNRISSAESVRVEVHAIDLSSSPLSGIIPIATRNPNAFDTPVVTGKKTDAYGRSEIYLPVGETLFVRGWDEQLRYFANSFGEIPASQQGGHAELRVVMAPSAAFKGQLFTPDEIPLAEITTEIMFEHASMGPWWPVTFRTDAEGRFSLPHVPPGAFHIRFETENGLRIELPEISLRPGAERDIGPVQLLD